MPDTQRAPVAYKAVVLAAVLLVLGLLFRQLATLMLAVLMTIIIAIPLSAGATRLERHGVPRALGALLTLLAGLAVLAGVLALIIPTFIDQANEFVDDVPDDRPRPRADGRRHHRQPAERGRRQHPGLPAALHGQARAADRADHLDRVQRRRGARRPDRDPDHRLLHGGAARSRSSTGRCGWCRPSRRRHARHVMERLRAAWIGWMQGVVFDMFISGTLLYIGLTIIGLDFAILFAVADRAARGRARTSARSWARSRRCCSRSRTRPARRSRC